MFGVEGGGGKLGWSWGASVIYPAFLDVCWDGIVPF